MLIRSLGFAVAIAVSTPLSASAQIYAWRDVNGTLVLSDRKLDHGAQTYVVPNAGGIRATTPVGGVNGDEFEPLIQQHAARNSLRPELVRAVIQVESGYNPRARSPRGAMGLMQLMPATARELGVVDPYNPGDNIRGGCAYLRRLIDRYDGNEELALAAYNAGAGAVDRYGRTIPPYRETRDYVKKVGAIDAGDTHRSSIKPQVVYKSFEIVDGRAIPRYSSRKPATGTYEVVVQ